MITSVAKKPSWLNKKIKVADNQAIKSLLTHTQLHTVCEEARCPNITECFRKKTLTFLIMGRQCTRQCRFCSVAKETTLPLDAHEPRRVAEAVATLKLLHVVITSPTRDDIPDGGASHFADTVAAIRAISPSTAIELLIPDFQGDEEALKTIIAAGPDILGHNLETVPRLYPAIRPGVSYARSLEVLARSKRLCEHMVTKSAVMVGLGETEEELHMVFADLQNVECDFLSIGQYLQPSREHYPVARYYTLQEFNTLKSMADSMGFACVKSGPYVRSSFHAADYIIKG